MGIGATSVCAFMPCQGCPYCPADKGSESFAKSPGDLSTQSLASTKALNDIVNQAKAEARRSDTRSLIDIVNKAKAEARNGDRRS